MKLNNGGASGANEVSIFQLPLEIDGLVVDGGAITAAEIAYKKIVAAPGDLRVISRDIRVIFQRDRIIKRAPNRYDLADDLKLPR